MLDQLLKMLPLEQLESKIAKSLGQDGESILLTVVNGELKLLSGKQEGVTEEKQILFKASDAMTLKDLITR